VQPVAKPSGFGFPELDTRHVLGGVSEFMKNVRLYIV